MPTCPIDGCGSPHDTWGGVAVHIWKTQADDHDMAESKDGALVWLAENGHMSGDASPVDMSADASSDTPTEEATTDGGDAPISFPENPDADDDPEPASNDDPAPESIACPSCDSDRVVDSDRTLREIPNLAVRHRTALKKHDKHCVDCGEVFNT